MIISLPQEILEHIFWAIDCPLTAQHYFENVLVGDSTLGTKAEFFRFVMTGNRYQSFQRLKFLRQDLPDDVILYKMAQRSLFARNLLRQRRSLLVGKFGKLGLT